jgi:hypothetical protein
MEELSTISPIKQSTIVLISLGIIMSFVGEWSPAMAQTQEINLIGQQNIWKTFADAILSQNNTDLHMIVVTDNNGKLWNRIFLQTQINSTTNKSQILNLDYASKSFLGNATFFAEIRGKNNTNMYSNILWMSFLNNTNGLLSNKTFTLPNNILNQPIEFRLYATTDVPGDHALHVKKASIMIH